MSGRQLQLLVVADDPKVLREVGCAATRWGYDVEKASTPGEGVPLLQCRPDLVILDIGFAPGGAARIIAMPAIVAVTGLATLQESFALG